MRQALPLALVLALSALSAHAQSVLGTVDGPADQSFLGAAVKRIHDFNADGWLDYVAGAPGEDVLFGTGAALHVLSGRYLVTGQGAPILQTVSWNPASGNGAGSRLGASLDTVGDLDGNGLKDLLAGAPDFVPQASFAASGAVVLTDLVGGVTRVVVGEGFDRLGTDVALFGDLNGDGVLDVLAAAPGWGPTFLTSATGKAVVLSGAGLLQNTRVELRAHYGTAPGDAYGKRVAVGDLTGDQFGDYAVGSPGIPSGGGVDDSGRVEVREGKTGALLRSIAGGPAAEFGASLSMELDFDGDGKVELVVGAPGSAVNGTDAGSAYVYSGAALTAGGILLPLHTWNGPSGSRFGSSVGIVDDASGDGIADIAIGAPGYQLLGQKQGMVRVYSGATGELLATYVGSPNQRMGSSVGPAWNVNGVPGAEIVIGSELASITGTERGRVSLVSVFPNQPKLYCTAKSNSLGCLTVISSTGTPSKTSAAPFQVRATNVLNNVPGILFYGFDANALPFQGGFLCVAPPITRLPGQSSKGTPPPASDCSGSFDTDMKAVLQSGADPALQVGREVFCQYWSRDGGSPSTTNLTNALSFLINP